MRFLTLKSERKSQFRGVTLFLNRIRLLVKRGVVLVIFGIDGRHVAEQLGEAGNVLDDEDVFL